MDRRDLLAGAGTTMAVAVAGCLGNLDGGDTEIADVEFETGIDVETGFSDDPTVQFGDDEIRVTGKYPTGNGCYDEYLEDPSYNAERDELHVYLTREHNGNDGCDDLLETVSYRVRVRVAGDRPGTVRATEDGGGETVEENDRGLLSL